MEPQISEQLAVCGSCHLALPIERFTLSRGKPMDKCKGCRSQRERERRQAEGDRIRELDRARYARTGSRYDPAYYQRNKERSNTYARAWVEANPERRREISRESARRIRAANPEKAREASRKSNAIRAAKRPPAPPRPRKYATEAERREAFNVRRRAQPRSERERSRHAEREKERRRTDPAGTRERDKAARDRWRAENPEAYRRKGQRDSSKRNALKRNADLRSVTERDLHRLLVRQQGCCAYCGKPEPTTLDHVVPLVRGGRHAIGNLVWACAPCNKSKGGRLVVELRHGRSYRRQPAA